MKSVKKFLINNPDIGNLEHQPAVQYMDSSATVLPADGPSMMADSISLKDGDRVLFSNLSNPALNNQIYVVHNVSGVLTLKVSIPFGSTNSMPKAGYMLLVSGGSHQGELRCFDSAWELFDLDVINGPTASVSASAISPAADVAANSPAAAVMVTTAGGNTYSDASTNAALASLVSDINADRAQINAILSAIKAAGLMS